MLHDISMTIDGAAVASDQRLDVVDPATGAVIGSSPICTGEQLDAAMAAASAAGNGWSRDDDARRHALRDVATILRANVDELAGILTAEQGKPLADAAGEVRGSAAWFDYYANLDVGDQVVQDDERAQVIVRRRPIGVVAAISPWNVPLLLANWKVAPALRAGNTVVLKPSPFTPLSTLRMGEILSEILPPGVLNVVAGTDELGVWMTAHPTPRKVSFTGSIATGKRVAVAAAADLKRMTLELGGNDPAIVLDDVDIASVAPALFESAFNNAGQICCAAKRVYVHESRHDELAEALVEIARTVKVGPGTAPDVRMGPLATPVQRDHVERLVDQARDAGAQVLTGGRRMGDDGYFYEPTIVTNADPDSDLVAHEQFGPALPLISYDDEAAALGHANATNYGLGASVWSADPGRAADLADRIQAGTVWTNSHRGLGMHIPFGGVKWSGVGIENGPWGLDAYTDIQVLNRAR